MALDLRVDHSSPTHRRNRLSLLRYASRPRNAGPMVRFGMPDALKLSATVWLIAVTAVVLTAACGRVSLGPPTDSTVDTAGASGSGGEGANTSGPACGDHRCAATQICCILDGTCIDPTSAATSCTKPTVLPRGALPGTRTCGSNADCTATEFCEPSIGCLCGPGTCVERNNCGTSTGGAWCGCDGVSYPNVQTACRKGVKPQGPGACGSVSTPGDTNHDPMIFCGSDIQCPNGLTCCPINGRCLDPTLPELCAPPPSGARQACLTDRQCFAEVEFCNGPGCSGPGGCVVAGGLCSGVLDPVCGCDGKTYTDDSCTLPAGVRTAHMGPCETP